MNDVPTALFPFAATLAQDGAPDFPGRNAPASSNGAPTSTGQSAATEGADGSSQPLGQTGQQQRQPGMFGDTFLLIMLGFLAFMIISSIFAGRKQKKQRAEMLSSLGKHDRVLTSGGLIGTIVEVKDSELVLRIDDATGARAHFSRDAIAHVVKSANAASAD
ncbi:MAG: hypothetical protein Tsb0013_18490 [Phycisphaerales bacterium]